MKNIAITYKDSPGKLNNSSKPAQAKFQIGNRSCPEQKKIQSSPSKGISIHTQVKPYVSRPVI